MEHFHILENIKYNLLSKNVHTDISHAQYLLITKHTILDIAKHADINVKGKVTLGTKRIKGSTLETRILVENGASLDFKGDATIMYGADIEAFNNSKIIFGKSFISNINFTCIAADKIEIGDNVSLDEIVSFATIMVVITFLDVGSRMLTP